MSPPAKCSHRNPLWFTWAGENLRTVCLVCAWHRQSNPCFSQKSKRSFSGMRASSLINTLITLPRGERNFSHAEKKQNAHLGEEIFVILCLLQKKTQWSSSWSWHLFNTNILSCITMSVSPSLWNQNKPVVWVSWESAESSQHNFRGFLAKAVQLHPTGCWWGERGQGGEHQ